MRTRIIEATNGFNHGKFLVGEFDHERQHRSALDGALLFLPRWGDKHIWVMDLETGEGAIFPHGGHAGNDLNKHRIWVCPMFEPFLEWLYTQDVEDLDNLPALVDLPDAPAAMQGYRRPGPAPDANCHTLPDGSCVGSGCMHDRQGPAA